MGNLRDKILWESLWSSVSLMSMLCSSDHTLHVYIIVSPQNKFCEFDVLHELLPCKFSQHVVILYSGKEFKHLDITTANIHTLTECVPRPYSSLVSKHTNIGYGPPKHLFNT